MFICLNAQPTRVRSLPGAGNGVHCANTSAENREQGTQRSWVIFCTVCVRPSPPHPETGGRERERPRSFQPETSCRGSATSTILPYRLIVWPLPVAVATTPPPSQCFCDLSKRNLWMYHSVSSSPDKQILERNYWKPRASKQSLCFQENISTGR